MISTKSLLVLFLTAANPAVTAFVLKPSTPTASRLGDVPPGFTGGFRDSNPDYSYGPASPDLSDLPITGNLDNIEKITRMQKVIWPQFSWQTRPGDESSRVFQAFAQDISRIGYDDSGRIWSIICPQRGFPIPVIGTLMLEVTVTGVNGWVDEPSQSACATMGVEGLIWFEASENNPLVAALEQGLDSKHFPFSKKHAIKAKGHALGKPYEEFWPMLNGTDPQFFHPQFAQHWDEAYSVYNLQVEIGKQIMTGIQVVDDFNTAILKIFNLGSGNILAEGQKVAWNVWTTPPEIVDTEEWKGHAKKWLDSITGEAQHELPEDESPIMYYDGTKHVPDMEGNVVPVFKILKKFVSDNWDQLKGPESSDRPSFLGYFKDHLFEVKKNHIKKRLIGRIKDRFD